MTIAVECVNIRKTFETSDGPFRALDGANLEVPANRFTALVGPSGCGKTTLLHIIAGLDTEFEGDLVSSIEDGGIAYLFQEPRLLPWLTAEQNLALILEARGESRTDALKVARQYLQLVGLDGFENQFPAKLSGGMQQRVALARALAVDPGLMLMDEPFANLDELTARKLRAELLRLFQEIHRTVIFVTHNVTEAAFLADRVVVMGTKPGRIVAEIPVDIPRPREYDGPEVAAVAREVVRNLQWD
ncbi:MAG: ABC transporter ATP-binding protein [Chloroflexi bacterium]|nr:ABC transporter ATP-binding protein [Chloroflexota bacterium]